VRVTELHVSAIATMVGIQQTTILNDLHEIHDLPREGNSTVFVGIDRQVDGLVLSSKCKGRGTEATNHARTGAVQGVISDGRGVTVGGRKRVSEPSILRGTIARGPAIAILIRESDQEAGVGGGDGVVTGRAVEAREMEGGTKDGAKDKKVVVSAQASRSTPAWHSQSLIWKDNSR
jgi:hypothetical protein